MNKELIDWEFDIEEIEPNRFLNVRKGTKVKRFMRGILKGYIMLEDNWITEYDKFLFNKNNEKFSILDFKEHMEINADGYHIKKVSCVKLDKDIIGDEIFYMTRQT